MRAFVAVTPPEAVCAQVAALIRELSAAHADIRWVPQPQLHLTLRFLSELSDTQRDALIARLNRVAQDHEPFAVQLAALDGFPTLRHPRVLWVGLSAGGGELTQLAAAIEAACAAVGLLAETRPFTPHLTIGRVRSPEGSRGLCARLETLRWKAPEAWMVQELTLYQSILESGGARHIALAGVPLRGG